MVGVIGAPERTEAPEYYFKYIDRVPAGNICDILAEQREDTYQLLRGISAEQSSMRDARDGFSSVSESKPDSNTCNGENAGSSDVCRQSG